MRIALLNKPTPALEECQLTFLGRDSIQLEFALQQHAEYAAALCKMGVHVEMLEVNQSCPDAVFVEDTAIILDEVAVITSMGSASRRTETAAMAGATSNFRRDVRRISLPATIDGGDVLRVGKTLFVGKSSRTNDAGINAFEEIVKFFSYAVHRVQVSGCLHLKTGITALNDETVVCNPDWVDVSRFADYRLIQVDAREPWGANALRIGDRLLLNTSYPRTADRIDALNFECVRVDISEFGKAEAGLTCLSIVFEVENR